MPDPDILTPDADDAPGMAALTAAIRQYLTPEERRQFDADLRAWNRRYAEAMQQLAESDEWREIEQWRALIRALAGGTRAA